MPYVSSGEMVQATSVSKSEFTRSFETAQMTTAGLIPMMYAGMKVGQEIELKILDLLQFHFIDPTRWAANSFLYFMCISLIPMGMNLLGMLVLIPEALSTPLNIFFFLVEDVEGVVTGILLGTLFKKGRSTAIACFMVMLIVCCVSVLSFGNRTVTYIFTAIIPAFSISYQLYLSNFTMEPDWGIFWMGVGLSFFYIAVTLVIINWQIIQGYIKRFQVRNRAAFQAEDRGLDGESDPNTILQVRNVQHIYPSGTYAIKGVSLDVPKG